MIIKKYMFTGQLHRHDHEEQRAVSPATSCDKQENFFIGVSSAKVEGIPIEGMRKL